MSPSQWDIVRLGLEGNAYKAAIAVKRAHSGVVFTSGHRTIEEQGHAMAANIIRGGRQWMVRTYKPSEALDACQAWIDDHPEGLSKEAIAAGLVAVMRGLTAGQLEKLSKHLIGHAFDVKPVGGFTGQMLLNDLRSIVKQFGGILIEREGGLTVWHAQF